MTPESGLELVALNGEDPLGFLAALGVLRILPGTVRLKFNTNSGVAVLTGAPSVDWVVERLVSAAVSDDLAFGLPSQWVPRKIGTGGADPARLHTEEFGELLKSSASGWPVSLWSDITLDDKRPDTCTCTPFYAAAGQQTLRSMFEKPTAAVRARGCELAIREALFSWRRVAKVTGENLDIRALREAGETQDGGSAPAGVPGATWLACAAIPFFRMSGDGKRPAAVGWDFSRRSRFFWPLWRDPLNQDAAAVLLDHPLVRDFERFRHASARVSRRAEALRALGVFSVVSAERTPTSGGKSEGVLVTRRVGLS